MSSAATRTMNRAITCWNNCKEKEQDYNFMACLTRYNQRTNFFKGSIMITLYVDQEFRINIGCTYRYDKTEGTI